MSKLMFFDFICGECGHQFEELVKSDSYKSECPNCSSDASRQIATPMINYRRMGVDPDFPTAGVKWAKMQEQRKREDKSA